MKRLILKSACIAALALVSLAPERARAQEFSIGAYGSVDYEAVRTVYRDGSPSTTENGFRVPTMDVFFRGSSGNWSFLSEVLLDIDEGNAFAVDVDRLQVSYEFAEWLLAKIKQEVFKGDMKKPTTVNLAAECFALVKRSAGGICVVDEASAKNLPDGAAILKYTK